MLVFIRLVMWLSSVCWCFRLGVVKLDWVNIDF